MQRDNCDYHLRYIGHVPHWPADRMVRCELMALVMDSGPVSILGFENCQSFFFGHCPCTVHSTCQADTARPMPSGIYHILLAKRHCDRHISLQHASNCIKNTILSPFFYIKLVVYYNKRSWKSRGIADLKRNP